VPIFISYLLPLACWGCGVLSEKQEKRDRPVHKKRKERKESFHSCGSKKRDFSDDDDDEGVYIFLSEKKMAQRSPRKSLQLNRANTPINFSGPMQDVNFANLEIYPTTRPLPRCPDEQLGFGKVRFIYPLLLFLQTPFSSLSLCLSSRDENI